MEMTYVPEGFKAGCIISVISFMALLAILMIGRQKSSKSKQDLPRILQKDVKDMS